jgi:hypothetical protein
MQCPRGHDLEADEAASYNLRICDECRNRLPSGGVFARCESCDYDVCASCIPAGLAGILEGN